MLIINFLLCFWKQGDAINDILYSLAASFGAPYIVLLYRADTVDTNKDMTTNTVKKAEAAIGNIRRFPIVSFLKFCLYLSRRTFSSEQFHISIWVKMEKIYWNWIISAHQNPFEGSVYFSHLLLGEFRPSKTKGVR